VLIVNRNVFFGSLKRKSGASVAIACWNVKSPAAPGGNIDRTIGLGDLTVVFSVIGL
jgi:hypothetical protein